MSFKFIWRTSGAKNIITNSVLAAVFFALSVTTQIGYAGILMEGPFTLLLILRNFLLNLDNLKIPTKHILHFMTVSALLLIPLIINSLGASSITQNHSLKTIALDYVFGSIHFTFRNYNLYLSFFNGFNTPYWEAVILISVLGGLFYTNHKILRTKVMFPRIALLLYLLLVWTITMNHLGWLDILYLRISAIDVLDSVVFFLLMQLFCIAFLLPYGLKFISSLIGTIPVHFKFESLREAEGGHYGKSDRLRLHMSIDLIQIRRNIVVIFLSSLLFIAAIASAFLPLMNLSKNLNTTQSNDVYASPQYFVIHNWFNSLRDLPNRSILVFPATFQIYSKVSAFIPVRYLWFIPFLGNAISTGYNATIMHALMSLLYKGEVGAFAYTARLDGVHYILDINDSITSSIPIFPDYLGYPQLSLNSDKLSSLFNSDPQMLTLFHSNFASMYRLNISEFQNSSFSTTILFQNTIMPKSVESKNLLPDPTFSNTSVWNRFLDNNIELFGNGTSLEFVNASSSVPYDILWSNIGIPQQSTNRSIAFGQTMFSAEDFNVTFNLSFNYTISSNTYLQPEILWYNVTNPVSFFSQFATDSWGKLNPTNDSVRTFLENVSIPSGAQLGRLVFAAGSPNNDSGAVYISNPEFNEVLTTVNSETSIALQISLLSLLIDSKLLPPNTLLLPSMQVISSNAFDSSAYSMGQVYPSIVFDTNGNSSFLGEFNNSVPENLSHLRVLLFITGNLGIGGSVELSSQNTTFSSANMAPSSNFLMGGIMIQAPGWLTFHVHSDGNFTFGSIGEIVILPTPNGKSHINLQLPIGILRLSVVGGRVTPNYVYNTPPIVPFGHTFYWYDAIPLASLLVISLFCVMTRIPFIQERYKGKGKN